MASEGQTDLGPHGYKGVVAYWRPMDLEDKARWVDSCRKAGVDPLGSVADVIGLKKQLLRITGLEVEEIEKVEGQPDKKTTRPFDVEKDFSRLGLGFLNPIWKDIQEQSSLSEIDSKN